MTDKELQEWEEECKEADEDIKHLAKLISVGGTIMLILYLIS
tara:strand:+ start:806 stop:931 length:126 start_codon:yes stop_codon:yes gene_type:complete